MPVIAGFDKLASVNEEQITDKVRRRVVSGRQGTMPPHTSIPMSSLFG